MNHPCNMKSFDVEVYNDNGSIVTAYVNIVEVKLIHLGDTFAHELRNRDNQVRGIVPMKYTLRMNNYANI